MCDSMWRANAKKFAEANHNPSGGACHIKVSRNRKSRGFEDGFNPNTAVFPRDPRKSRGFHSRAGL